MATTRTHPAAVHRRVRLLSDCQLGKVYNFCSPLLDTHAKERCSVHTCTSSMCSTSYPNALVQTVVPPHLQELLLLLLLLHTSQGCSEVSVRVEPVFLKWHDALRLLFSNFFIRSILFRINWNSKRLSWCWHSRNELRPKCRKWWCASSIKGGASQQGTDWGENNFATQLAVFICISNETGEGQWESSFFLSPSVPAKRTKAVLVVLNGIK